MRRAAIRRSIYVLLAAKAAGDPLTDEEGERLTRFAEHSRHTFYEMAGGPPAAEWEAFVETGDEHEELRATILRGPNSSSVRRRVARYARAAFICATVTSRFSRHDAIWKM